MTINHFSFDIIYITGNPTKSSRLCLQQKKKSNDTPSMVMLRMHKMREQGEKLVISFFYITNLQFYNWFEGIRITCIMLLLCSCGLSMTHHHTHTHTHILRLVLWRSYFSLWSKLHPLVGCSFDQTGHFYLDTNERLLIWSTFNSGIMCLPFCLLKLSKTAFLTQAEKWGSDLLIFKWKRKNKLGTMWLNSYYF